MEIIKKYFGQLNKLQCQQLEALESLYREWNERINVISRKDMDALYERHVLHALSIAKVLSFDEGIQVMDIGTGGGFPGIPLAILFPKTHFVLADSIAKKIKVVQEITLAIELKNTTVFNGRAEEWKGEKFDLTISRAVAPLAKLCKWSQKVLKHQNQGLICLKGGDLTEEIKLSGMPTRCWDIADFFPLSFFETKKITWSEIKV